MLARVANVVASVAALVAIVGALAWSWPLWPALVLVVLSAGTLWLVRPRRRPSS